MKKKLSLLLLALLMPMLACADVVERNGIYYNLISKAKVAEVTKHPNHPKGYKGKITIPDEIAYDGSIYKVTWIGEEAFRGNDNVTSVIIGDNVTNIGKLAFFGCEKLTSITMGNSVETIHEQAFSYMPALTELKLSNSVKAIGHAVFMGSEKLTSVDLNEGLETIDIEAFDGCANLESIKIPNSVKIIGSYSEELDFHFSSCFWKCKKLVSVQLGNGISVLGGQTFQECASLKSIVIPVNVTKIEQGCFSQCSELSSVAILGNVTRIGDRTFDRCKELGDMYCYASDVPALGAEVFKDCYLGYATLHVPANLINTYKDTPQWKDFGNIVALKEGDPGYGETQPYVVYDDGTLTFYYDNLRSSRQGTTYDLTPGEWGWSKWFDINGSVTKVVFDPLFANARPNTTKGWFDGCENLTEIEGISYLNTSEVVNMYCMFVNCSSLTNLDVSKFNTEKVTDMAGMFYGCSSLANLDLSSFNTANVTTMDCMFYGCRNLTSLDLSSFDTNALKTESEWMSIEAAIGEFAIRRMFYNCSNLSKLILGNGFATKEGIKCQVFHSGNILNTVVFTGDIPASINSKFFEGVGTAVAPATLAVQEQYKANYQAKFDGNMFYGGYFTLEGVEFKKGDLNGDGEVNNVDLVNVLTLIMNGKYETNADLNGDGVVNVADIVELVKIINSGNGTGSGYFWLGNTLPTSRNFPTLNGKEVEGIVTTYTSLGEAMAKASRTYSAGEWAVVMYPSSWGTKNDLVFLDSANMKYYVVKQKVLSDFPDYLYYESTEKIGANTTITLSTESLAKAAGATLSSQLIK